LGDRSLSSYTMGTIFSASSDFSADVGERSIAISSAPVARHVRNGFTPNTSLLATGRWCGPRGEKVFIETGDGKRLAAIHVDVGSSKGNNSKKSAAIIFHGNGMTHEDMGDFAWVLCVPRRVDISNHTAGIW
jgi:hypothetical protein